MKRFALAGLLALAFFVPASRADRMAPDPIALRAIKANTVVVGKVTKIEDKTVKVNEQEHQVAVVKVGQGLHGADGLTHVRVAFTVNKRRPTLTEGQEGIFFLAPAPGQAVYLPAEFDYFEDKQSPQFEQGVKQAAVASKVLAKPDEALEAKDPTDRYLAAALLVYRYRMPRPGAMKQEAIDAKQSQRILEALAAADWAKAQEYQLAPLQVFMRLGLTEKDGWNTAGFKTVEEFHTAAKKWLKEHGATYRIQKFVADR